jgi:hypothetical protein
MEQNPDSIRKRLVRLRRKGCASTEFICADEVKEVLKKDDIRICISTIPMLEENERDIRRYTSMIWETSLIIFAILLIDRHESNILKFLFRRDTDKRLPFSKEDLYYLKDPAADHFEKHQWALLPVLLTCNDMHRDPSPKEILPFLSEERIGSGGFGDVWKVKVYPSCQNIKSHKLGEASSKVSSSLKIHTFELILLIGCLHCSEGIKAGAPRHR